MALMFPRIAQSFIKNGYYPTDESTLGHLMTHITRGDEPGETVAILDPCAGEGVALAEFKHHLGDHIAMAYGIEYDPERAYHAKSLLDMCIHGDVQDCMIKQQQFGLLFLNPPYGDLVSDSESLSSRTHAGRQRLEKLFYELTFKSLVFGGIGILVLPQSVFDKELLSWISKHFKDVTLVRAVDQTFKQLVVMGVRSRIANNDQSRDTLARLTQMLLDDAIPRLAAAPAAAYHVPASHQEPSVCYTRMDTEQLADDLVRSSQTGLWPQFHRVFHSGVLKPRRPLFRLSNWHLALSLAAGTVSGIVTSNSGERTLLVKGGTHKARDEKCELIETENGDFTEKRIVTDRFVPNIRAIDMTSGPNYGTVFHIQ